MKILAIQASPLENTEAKSTSTEALNIFLNELKDHEIIRLNLNKEEVGQTTLNSSNFSNYFTDGLSDKHIDLLKSVDKVVIAFPMINFGIPSMLKNYLDHILVAKKTFQYKYDGKGESEGLLTNIKTVQLIMSQGADEGWYQFSGFGDMLEGIWKFAGAQQVKQLLIAGTKTKENLGKPAQEQLIKHIEKIKKEANKF